MTTDNVELVRGWFERWNSGDRFLDEELHPQVEVVSRLQPAPYRGRDAFRRWTAEIDEQFQAWRLVADDWRAAGEDRVVALGHLHLVGHGSGVEYDQPMGWVVVVDDEKLRRLESFLDHAEALEAASLDKPSST